ncbi:MAG: hypothetical protein RR704_02620 [Stenotrophomonas sp.]|jgi:uncharacterized protein (DUF2345 family)
MPGNFIIKASQHPFLAGERLPAQLASLRDNRAALFDEAFVLKDKTLLCTTRFALRCGLSRFPPSDLRSRWSQ